MRPFLRACLLFGAGFAACLLGCELLLRGMPVDEPIAFAPAGRPTLLVPNAPHTDYQYSARWFMLNAQAGRTNNYGQVEGADFQRDSQPLIVVGDSYVESLMNPEPVRLQSRLAEDYRVPVYGLGVSGLSASDYVVMARQARAEFKPRAAVFAIIDGDFVESLQLQPRRYRLRLEEGVEHLDYTPLSPSPVMQRLRASPLGKLALLDYLQYNLAFTPTQALPQLRKAAPHARQPDPAAPMAVVDWFLEELPKALELPPACISLAVDADRYAIYDPKLASPPKDAPEVRRHLIEAARARGFNVVDLEPVFRTGYARDGLKFDHWPLDRHWNALGHRTVAQAIEKSWAASGAASACELKGG